MPNKYFTLAGGYQHQVQITSNVQAWSLNGDSTPNKVKVSLLNKAAELVINTPWDIDITRSIQMEQPVDAIDTVTICTRDIWGETKCIGLFLGALQDDIELPKLVSFKRPDVLIPVIRILAFSTEEVPLQIEKEIQVVSSREDIPIMTSAEKLSHLNQKFQSFNSTADGATSTGSIPKAKTKRKYVSRKSLESLASDAVDSD